MAVQGARLRMCCAPRSLKMRMQAVAYRVGEQLSMNPPLIRHRERSTAIHRGKSAVMDCRAALAVTRTLFKVRVRYRAGYRKLVTTTLKSTVSVRDAR
jgi:hypothetical protein